MATSIFNVFAPKKETRIPVQQIGGNMEDSFEAEEDRTTEAPEAFKKVFGSINLDPTKPVRGFVVLTEGVGKATTTLLDALSTLGKDDIFFSLPHPDKKENPQPAPLREFASPGPKPEVKFVQVNGEIMSVENVQELRGINKSSTVGITEEGKLTADAQTQVDQKLSENKKEQTQANSAYQMAQTRAQHKGAGANNDLDKAGEGSSRLGNLKAG